MFAATAHLNRKTTRDEHLLKLGSDVRHVVVGVLGDGFDLLLEHAVSLGLEMLEAQVLELRLEPLNAEAARKRRVDLECLPGDALLRRRRHVVERSHVVETVGQLHEQNPDVARHRHEHLAKALRLTIFAGREVDLAELGHAIDEERDLFTEHGFDVIDAGFAILDDVV